MGSIWRKTHVALPRHTTNSEQTIGAMEEMSGKVQNASTYRLSPNPRLSWDATVSTPWGQWRKYRRRFKMQTLTGCDAKITSTRTAAGQFKVVQWGDG